MRITNEEASRQSDRGRKTAVVENEEAAEDEPRTAFFDIRGAGDWIGGIRSVRLFHQGMIDASA